MGGKGMEERIEVDVVDDGAWSASPLQQPGLLF
jgi:hypothetical protein